MPSFAATARSEPSRRGEVSTTGAPKSIAMRFVSLSEGETRTCGRFVRWIAAECRSIPKSQRSTTSCMKMKASREPSEPEGEPGKQRLRSRLSGR